MRLDFAFRLANYLSLVLACLCLCFAETLFLPNIGWLAPPMILLMVTAFSLEGRWALPNWVANVLAVVLGGGMMGAIAVQAVSDPDSFAATLPLPITLVPYAGPLLMVLLVIKLFRSKHIGDYWQLQAMGLLLAGLACVLGGGDPLFGLLLCGYFATAMWALALFYLRRQEERASGSNAIPGSPVVYVPWRWQGLPRLGWWFTAVLACSLVLALVTPRLSPSQWNAFELMGRGRNAARMETGIPEVIDLNRTGQVEVNDDVVLEVRAEDREGNPMVSLPIDQRWRGAFLDRYEKGRWRGGRTPVPGTAAPVVSGFRPSPPPMPTTRGKAGSVPEDVPRQQAGLDLGYFDPSGQYRQGHTPRIPWRNFPDLGPDEYILTFTLSPRKAGGLFLADPVQLLPGMGYLPIRSLMDPYTGPGDLFMETPGGIGHVAAPRGQVKYQQITRPVPDVNLSPPVDLSTAYQLQLCLPPPESIRQWTDDLLKNLLDPKVLKEFQSATGVAEDGKSRVMRPALRERLARLLCEYLRNSGDFHYSLDLERSDETLDPIDDFLRNVKEGHCERFAAALALMLRAEGIPARVVMGFRGWEAREDGLYVVRNSNAHAWVEALIAHREPTGKTTLRWLTLDPTPTDEVLPKPPFSLSRWWDRCQHLGLELWRSFVVEYGPDEQGALADEVWDAVRPSKQRGSSTGFRVAAVLAVASPIFLATVAFVLWRKKRRRLVAGGESKRLRPALRPFARLLDLLASHGRLTPGLSQTPREFAAIAAAWLTRNPATFALADLPKQIAALYYRIRFGGEEPDSAELQQIDGRLDELATALATTARVATDAAAG
jgi:hypothetical protein